MCSWIDGAIANIELLPSNPADIGEYVLLSRRAQADLWAIGQIASELGWHADASLDTAWNLIQEYDLRKKTTTHQDCVS